MAFQTAENERRKECTVCENHPSVNITRSTESAARQNATNVLKEKNTYGVDGLWTSHNSTGFEWPVSLNFLSIMRRRGQLYAVFVCLLFLNHDYRTVGRLLTDDSSIMYIISIFLFLLFYVDTCRGTTNEFTIRSYLPTSHLEMMYGTIRSRT